MKREHAAYEQIEVEEMWEKGIPDDQWAVYKKVIDAVRDEGIEFSLGGAFALATYSGHWRNTKDLDLYILKSDRERAIEVMARVGMSDYHEVEPYDRGWIYRAHCDRVIVDSIWAMPNRRTDVDSRWIHGGAVINIRGERLRVVPPEEMIWGKIYVMQRPRCDWPDIVNMLYGAGGWVDWEHLIARLEDDVPLLRGVMSLFSWLCPGRAAALPSWLWDRLHLPEPEPGPEFDRHRIELIETRPWFAPLIREQRPL